jgi:hypothetical protein
MPLVSAGEEAGTSQISYNMCGEIMTIDQGCAIEREADKLANLQIETLRRKSPLTSAQLIEYHARARQIRTLYAELDQIARANISMKRVQASYPRAAKRSLAS